MQPRKNHTSVTVIIILSIALLIIVLIPESPSSYLTPNAAEQEKVVIRDSQKTYRENITVELHKTNTSCYAVVTPATIANKAVTYTSQNPAIMTVNTVNNNGVYYAHITGIAEGVTTLTATTASGKTYSSYVTVYTTIQETPGIINCKTALKKTALETAESFIKTADINDIGTVKGRVGKYLYLDMPAGYLEKGYHIAYVEIGKVTIKCTGIQLDAASLTLYVKEKRKLNRRVLPILTSNRTVTFKSSNSSIASVSNKGTIRARKRGNAVITCTAADGSGISATCMVTVKQQVQKITIKKARITMTKGTTKQLTASICPKTADNQAVQWSSSNEKVATVDNNGTVTAVGAGEAVINCTAQDGSKSSGKCKITVEPVYKIELQDIAELTVGDTVKAQARLVEQEDQLEKKSKAEVSAKKSRTFIWSSSNKKIATVNKHTGQITAHHAGKFVLTCRVVGGKIIARKTVTVKKADMLANQTFKKLPTQKYVEYQYNQSVLLSPNANGLEWSSQNPEIAQIKDGVVTMKSSGTAIIICRKNNKTTKQCRLYLYKKAIQKYGIQKANKKKGTPQQKVSVLGTLTDNEIVIVSGREKRIAKESEVLMYTTKANRDYFYQNRDTLFHGIHFVNKDTLEFNNKEAIVYNIVDDTLYIHINVRFRGDAVQDMFTIQGLYGKIEKKGRYQKLVTEGIESTYSLDKVDFTMTPLPNNLKLKVVTKINDVTPRQYIRTTNSSTSPQQINSNYIIIQIGSYQEQPNKIIKPTLANGSYWYFTKQTYDDITVKKNSRSLYHYSHYRRNSVVKKNRKTIYLPTKEMLKQNVGKYYEVPSAVIYKRSAAHEMGHVLGLDDAYEYEGGMIPISRMSERLKDEDLIMKDGKKFDKISSVEMVMLLYGRNQSNEKSSISLQSFHNYSIYTHKDAKGIEHYEAGKLSEAVK